MKIRNRLFYVLLGFVLCLCMGIGGKLVAESLTRFRTETELKEKVAKRQEGMTLKQVYAQVKINTIAIKQLEERSK